jgi:hypothetical protein
MAVGEYLRVGGAGKDFGRKRFFRVEGSAQVE